VSADVGKAAASSPAKPAKRTPRVKRKKASRKKAVSAVPRAKAAEGARPRALFTRRPAAIVVAASAVLVVAALALGRDPSLRVSAAGDMTPQTAAPSDIALATVQPAERPAVAPRVATPVAVAAVTRIQTPHSVPDTPKRTEAVAVPTTSAPASIVPLRPAPVTMVAGAYTPAANTTSVESPAASPAVESNAAIDRPSQAPVTITGCLEATPDGSQFRLTDTEGDGAPKARGWRSGFIKKRPAPVDLVGLPDPAGSRTYVGHRVVATGLLARRELQVRSLASAGSLCD